MKRYQTTHLLTILSFICFCFVSAIGETSSRGIHNLLMQGAKGAKQSEKDRKQQEKNADKERKQAEKEQRRLAADQPVVEYDKFSDVTKVNSRPIDLRNDIFGAPQKTLFGSLPSVTSFRVVAVVFYKGQQNTSPNSVALVFNAQGHYHWFVSDRDLVFLADGNRLNLGRTEYQEGVASTGSTNEFMTIEIPVRTFAQIVRAKTVEFRLGSQSFSMYDLAAFRQVLPELPAQEQTYNQPSTEPLGLTLAGYSAIQTGMSYEDVVRILGSAGVETFRSGSGSFQMVSYTWRPEQPRGDFSPLGFLSATFLNGKLSGKGQMGLK